MGGREGGRVKGKGEKSKAMERQKGERKGVQNTVCIYIERMSDLFSVEMGTMIYTHAIVQFSLSVLVPGNDVITEIQTVIPINALIIETEHLSTTHEFSRDIRKIGNSQNHYTVYRRLFTFLVCL